MSFNDDIAKLRKSASGGVNVALRTLLQEKHLYQSVEIDATTINEAVKSKNGQLIQGRYLTIQNGFYRKAWQPTDGNSYTEETVSFTVPHIKIYCVECKRIEVFNPLTWNNALQLSDPSKQVFMLSFMCQSCRKSPEVFLIARAGLKLTLSGRFPMETAQVPDIIPKKDRKFFSDAIIAFQSGQVLAANFLLRTFIEQFLRTHSQSGITDIELLREEYLDSLPPDFKSRFPSLSDLYSQLSADIHAATGDPGLFAVVQEKILKHFDARRLFSLPDKTPIKPKPTLTAVGEQ